MWNNEKKLDMLEASFVDGVLKFKTQDEEADVYLSGNDIDKVVYRNNGIITTIAQNEKHSIVVGKENFERDVDHYLKPNSCAPTMRLGITKHKGRGTWSSLPHHFELSTEPGFEEVFFYLLEGEPSSAIQVGRGVWFDNTPVDAIWKVKDRTFSTVPMGYHPVVGEPGVHVSYIWVYLAKKKSWEKI